MQVNGSRAGRKCRSAVSPANHRLTEPARQGLDPRACPGERGGGSEERLRVSEHFLRGTGTSQADRTAAQEP